METGKEFFVKRYKKLGWKFRNVKPGRAIRVNTLKISNEELVKRLMELGFKMEKLPFLKNGYLVKETYCSVGAITEYLLGYYYIQEPASQRASEILRPQQNEVVLDMAAAPGGKTTHMAQIMENRGVIVALEKHVPRIIALKNNIVRMGVANVIAYNTNSMHADNLGIEFDKIMLDAPCSGNFTHEEGWFEKRNLESINEIAKVQRNLLRVAYNLLKKNGELVYATCSLEPEENEDNVGWFLKLFSDMKLVSKERIWPSEETQGFFIAKFRKGK